MHPDSPWDDVVLFQLAGPGLAAQLAQCLRFTWLAWTEPLDTGWGVAVELGPEPENLAHLLREVSTWVSECGLRSVAFQVDGRIYNLRPVALAVVA